ncbi:TlyA family RNA methyltransferase [[Acholeplasma] multilocale]|uniref:TlyA family RNA methyltransferase n=1 Tax=[Acholeplasma] multilocale TaxID=264638 RepID=UPI00047A159F|nr:TlyA family RNA methyltransferase [[Acholeplasma] multilocale]
MKKRIDELLVELGFAENRSKAKQYIKDQKAVTADGKLITKAGFLVEETANIVVDKNEVEFVSRAGLKLEKALSRWSLNIEDKTVLDIGASTGGFTECALNNGASKVYALDVGVGQLHPTLLNDSKVVNMEKFNFRDAVKTDFDQNIDFFCCDVSFISVEKILIPLKDIVEIGVEGVILIKPQFESEIEEVRHGKINSKDIHFKDIVKVIRYALHNGFTVKKITYSPIKGNKKQNIEYLALLERSDNPSSRFKDEDIWEIVDRTWKTLV